MLALVAEPVLRTSGLLNTPYSYTNLRLKDTVVEITLLGKTLGLIALSPFLFESCRCLQKVGLLSNKKKGFLCTTEERQETEKSQTQVVQDELKKTLSVAVGGAGIVVDAWRDKKRCDWYRDFSARCGVAEQGSSRSVVQLCRLGQGGSMDCQQIVRGAATGLAARKGSPAAEGRGGSAARDSAMLSLFSLNTSRASLILSKIML
ncbi:hypothetical protein NL676_016577 [Syzygium grande]|nr:hypothetical protein NL676_016577 [Syzygium grande]